MDLKFAMKRVCAKYNLLEEDMDKVNCPCKKRKCVRHGNCEECRKHHAESKSPRPCERKRKLW